MCKSKACKKSIIPPNLLEYISQSCDSKDKKCILNTLDHVNSLMKKSAKEDAIQYKDNALIYNKKTISEV
ncbi:hypothetical protein ID853_03460 [Xenorhabdus sp. Vera]|uniref:protealysin propeptide domain-containing protein n=1 Tax=Xenorhabdus TaxID=626 RepID=UPI0019A79B0F|nr:MULTISPECIES: protealysin propeptide domain-containing protein [unclassified Xenorhabdus]MBD2809964.1 hypothetical protein [Xenorhabdus sp. Vera]